MNNHWLILPVAIPALTAALLVLAQPLNIRAAKATHPRAPLTVACAQALHTLRACFREQRAHDMAAIKELKSATTAPAATA